MTPETFVRCWRPVSRALHWRRPHEAAALCQARVPAGTAWRAPFAGAAYARCPECDQALGCWLRDALTVSMSLPAVADK